MQKSENNTEYSQDVLNEKVILRETNENFNYLYPNGHRITHQMRWLKLAIDNGFKPYIAS